jgi:hypothetical protein
MVVCIILLSSNPIPIDGTRVARIEKIRIRFRILKKASIIFCLFIKVYTHQVKVIFITTFRQNILLPFEYQTFLLPEYPFALWLYFMFLTSFLQAEESPKEALYFSPQTDKTF